MCPLTRLSLRMTPLRAELAESAKGGAGALVSAPKTNLLADTVVLAHDTSAGRRGQKRQGWGRGSGVSAVDKGVTCRREGRWGPGRGMGGRGKRFSSVPHSVGRRTNRSQRSSVTEGALRKPGEFTPAGAKTRPTSEDQRRPDPTRR